MGDPTSKSREEGHWGRNLKSISGLYVHTHAHTFTQREIDRQIDRDRGKMEGGRKGEEREAHLYSQINKDKIDCDYMSKRHSR